MGKLVQLYRYIKGKSTLLNCLPTVDGCSITCNVVDRNGQTILSSTAPAAVIEGWEDRPEIIVFRSTVTNNTFALDKMIMDQYKLERIEGEGLKHYIFHFTV